MVSISERAVLIAMVALLLLVLATGTAMATTENGPIYYVGNLGNLNAVDSTAANPQPAQTSPYGESFETFDVSRDREFLVYERTCDDNCDTHPSGPLYILARFGDHFGDEGAWDGYPIEVEIANRWVCEPDCSTQRMTMPRFSPDGKTIYFIGERILSSDDSTRGIYSVPVEGGEATRIPIENSDSTPKRIGTFSLSHDGSTFAFSHKPEGENVGIFTVAVGGGVPRRVTDQGCRYSAASPSFSPNDQTIVFTSHIYSGDNCTGTGRQTVYTTPVNNDGTSPGTPLFPEDATEAFPSYHLSRWYPTYSPDGKYIAFGDNNAGVWRLATAPATGGNVTTISNARCVGCHPLWTEKPSSDTTRPTIASVFPESAATAVAQSTAVEATFSEAMDSNTLDESTFTLKEQGSSSSEPAYVMYDRVSREATLYPVLGLKANTSYTATVKSGSSGVKDVAGNTLEQDFGWTFTTAADNTLAPITTHTLSPPPNANGWNSSDVDVSLNATSAGGSEVKEITYSINGSEPNTVPGNVAGISLVDEGVSNISYHATDTAGNVEADKTFAVKVDKSAPQVTPANVVNHVWRNSPVSAEFTASDSGSGLANLADASFTLTASEESASEDQPTVVSRTFFDAAGNLTTRKVSALIDLTNPQVTASVTPQPNAAGWNNSNATVEIRATDSLGGSGIKEITYSINGAQPKSIAGASTDIPLSEEGITTISYSATDEAGNSAAQRVVTAKLDKGAPTSSIIARDSAGNGYTSGAWTNKDVTIELNAHDASGSGVKGISYSINGSANQTYNATNKILVTNDGVSTISYFATDRVGNRESPEKTFTVKLDKGAPKVTSAAPTGTGVARGTNVTATFSEMMDPTSINSTTFKIYECPSTTSTNCTTHVSNVAVSPSTDGLSATLNPYGSSSTLLLSKTRYKAVITTGAKDAVGNALDQNATTSGNQQKEWYFTTRA